MTSSVVECTKIFARIATNYDILLQRNDKATNKRLTELGIEFNEKLQEWNNETIKILKDDSWRQK